MRQENRVRADDSHVKYWLEVSAFALEELQHSAPKSFQLIEGCRVVYVERECFRHLRYMVISYAVLDHIEYTQTWRLRR
jgi:hypothetical protein